MSRFGSLNNNRQHSTTSFNNRFGYNPFQNDIIFQKQNHWDIVRNNVDHIIQNSKILQNNESLIQEELQQERTITKQCDDEEMHIENSKCNNIETIYECPDQTPLATNPISSIVDESQKEEFHKTVVINLQEKPKQKLDFASAVLKYRNELARRKHKELQEEIRT